MTIGENIRSARKKLHMSQEELAEAIGSNRVTISKYENGSYLPSVPALKRLSDALMTTPDKLSGELTPETETVHLPQTSESRIISEGIDRMPPEDREKALNVLRAVYSDYFETAEDKMA